MVRRAVGRGHAMERVPRGRNDGGDGPRKPKNGGASARNGRLDRVLLPADLQEHPTSRFLEARPYRLSAVTKTLSERPLVTL